jgi:hypothetical protein
MSFAVDGSSNCNTNESTIFRNLILYVSIK